MASDDLFHSTLRGFNPPPLAPVPGAEGQIGFQPTALGNALLVGIAAGVAIPVVVSTPDIGFFRTDKDTQFILMLGNGSMETASVTGLPASSGRIESVTVLSVQNLAWDVCLFTKDTFTNADLDLDTYLSSVRFARGDGRLIDAVGAYRYDAFGLGMPYRDLDATTELHIGLVNRGPVAKIAGATGAVVVIIGFRADD